jgi:hypothetical protein
MKKLLALLSFISFTAAAQTNLNFSGTVSTSCSLSVSQPGSLVISNTQPNILGTSVAGGTPGVVGVSFIGTPTITVTLPNSFSSSPTLSFTPNFNGLASTSLLGSLTFSAGAANGTYSTGNSDTVTVNLNADSGGAAFPLGSYSAVVTVSCS